MEVEQQQQQQQQQQQEWQREREAEEAEVNARRLYPDRRNFETPLLSFEHPAESEEKRVNEISIYGAPGNVTLIFAPEGRVLLQTKQPSTLRRIFWNRLSLNDPVDGDAENCGGALYTMMSRGEMDDAVCLAYVDDPYLERGCVSFASFPTKRAAVEALGAQAAELRASTYGTGEFKSREWYFTEGEQGVGEIRFVNLHTMGDVTMDTFCLINRSQSKRYFNVSMKGRASVYAELGPDCRLQMYATAVK
jgi:hypothetical protein